MGMTTVSMETMWKIDQFSPRSISQIAESCALLGFCKEHTFRWMAVHVVARRQDFCLEQFATVIWSFAKASVKSEPLTSAVAEEVARSASTMTDDDFSRVAWAFSKLGAPALGSMQPMYHQHLQFVPQLQGER